MFSDWVSTSTTTEALWMEKSSHAPQIVAIANVSVAASTCSIQKINFRYQILRINFKAQRVIW